MTDTEQASRLTLTPRQARYMKFAPAVAFGLAAVIFAAVLSYNAWLSDDAFISFRVAWNAAHGYGLRWDIADRVQAFTNPLWTLLMTLIQWLGVQDIARVATLLTFHT